MRRKCRTCLCRTCLNTCCNRKECPVKKTECKRYSGFRQLSIFDTSQEPPYQSVPRHSLAYYGLTDERVEELEKLIQSGRYASVVRQEAHTANETIAEYILLSVTQNKSYDALRVKWELKEIERIPYCRTDFYGIRRYFYHLFNEKMKEIGK